MAASRSSHQFSAWDGTQDPLGPDLEALFDRLSEDVFQGWDFESALRRLLGQGWDDPEGRHQPGLEELMERLRRRRQEQLEQFNLDGVFNNIHEKLDNVLRQERRGIDDRLAAATDNERAQRILERVAAKRRETLDTLPVEPGGALKALQEYEFMDRGAERSFQELLDEMKQAVAEQYFKDAAANLGQLSGQDTSMLREMVRDLNGLMASHLAGMSEAAVQADYERFRAKWGQLFPNAPATFPEFLAQLQRQMAQTESLMQSLSPELRRQLRELSASVFDDPELQDQLAQLAGALELLSPRPQLGQRYSFFGDEQVPLDEAMSMMGRLQAMEELERGLRDVYRGGSIDEATRRSLRDLLGSDAGDSIDQLERISRELESAGLVERQPDGMQLTARGMRKIGHKALTDLFNKLKKDEFGNHPVPRVGAGTGRADETKAYEFGDAFDLDVQQTLMNAVRREAGDGAARTDRRGAGMPRLDKDDFEVHRTEATSRSSTVLLLDMSRSMPLRGYFYAAKKVAMALDSLIRTQFPRDRLHVVGFSDYAREIPPGSLPQLSVNEYVYGTNLQHGLMVARRLLGRDNGANKQIIIVSDGEPTAHMEGSHAVFFYPPLPETFHKTLLEVQRCTRDNITINTFMLESNHHLVQFVNRMTQLNHGRAFFISADRLGDYVLVDYARRRGSAA